MEQRPEFRDYPEYVGVIEAERDAEALLAIAVHAMATVDANRNRFDVEWRRELKLSIARLEDEMSRGSSTNLTRAHVALLAADPKRVYRSLSKAEIADVIEPSEDEAEAWAWGSDLADTSIYYAASSAAVLFGALAFSVLTYGLDTPSLSLIAVFAVLGWLFLAAANMLLGWGLYRQYVTPGYLNWESRGYFSAGVIRTSNFRARRIRWSQGAYAIGGLALTASISLGFLIRLGSPTPITDDQQALRLALLASAAVGLVVFGFGAWPVARAVISLAERSRRLGGARFSMTARLITVVLPAIGASGAFVVNWLFSR